MKKIYYTPIIETVFIKGDVLMFSGYLVFPEVTFTIGEKTSNDFVD